MTKKTELFEEIYDEGLAFIKMVEENKYCINSGEHSWEDIVRKRFYPEMALTMSNEDAEYIRDMMVAKRLITGGGVTFGYGNNNVKCSLSNCYFTPIKEDSLEGINKCCGEMMRTYSYRGGTGTDITILRPKSVSVDNAAITSSGSVSFMPMLSEVTQTIGQNGRRGALIVTQDVRHPDIMDFIRSKAFPAEVFGVDSLSGRKPDISGANISIKVTDKFMEAVVNDEYFDLIFPDIERVGKDIYNTEWNGDFDAWIEKGYPVIVHETLKARDILNAIADSAHICGDPGVSYWDRTVQYSTGMFDPLTRPAGLNPCGEQNLAPYNNCLLGAMILHKYVKNPWMKGKFFDINLFLKDLRYTVRFMDQLIDDNKHPLPQQTQADIYGRRIGIELSGLADALAMCGHPYDSDSALEFIDNIMSKMLETIIDESVEQAIIKEPCPALQTKDQRYKFVNQPFLVEFLETRPELKERIIKFGCRNIAWTTIGPAGTLSIIGGNCTSGCEPLYKIEYYRETRLNPGKQTRILHFPLMEFAMANDKIEELMTLPTEELKKLYNYVEADEIPFEKRIKMQAVLQKYIDNSISSTINLSTETKVEEIFQIYQKAWEYGLKGITVFRDGCKRGVLSTTKDVEDIEDAPQVMIVDKELFDEERAFRHRVRWKGNTKVYITVSTDEDTYPLEVFANVPKEVGLDADGRFNESLYFEKLSYWHSITRLVSALLRYGCPLDEVIKQLEKSSYGMFDLTAIIMRILKKYPKIDEMDEEALTNYRTTQTKRICPDCKKMGVINEGGCSKCLECGYSECG